MNGLPLSIWRGFGEFTTLEFSKFTAKKEFTYRRHHALAQLRNTLLPKLISAEFLVLDAEAFLKERAE